MKMKKIPPPILLLLCLILMLLPRRILPIEVIFGYDIGPLGLVLVAMGLLIGATRGLSFRREGTSIRPFKKPGNLVTGGVYRYSRNPMYLGWASR
jgi:protein-S-isoprenylcysteine O-methyltransferase Ste14